jgi:hypothetical protein
MVSQIQGETAKSSFQGSLYLSRESLGNHFFEKFQNSMHDPASHATWWITLGRVFFLLFSKFEL